MPKILQALGARLRRGGTQAEPGQRGEQDRELRGEPEPVPTPPRRVQVEGDLFHGRVPDGAVYVGRQAPGLKRSRFANPFAIKGRDRAEALRLYREHLATHPELAAAARSELAGRDVACWCKPSDPCHADVLLDLVNREGA
jgi:Domain of unknown function (DUF4326)